MATVYAYLRHLNHDATLDRLASADHVSRGREGGFMQVCHGKAAIIHRDRHCQQREPLDVRHGRRTLPVPPRRRLVQGGGDSDKAYAGIIGVRFGKSPLGLPAWIRAVFHQFQ